MATSASRKLEESLNKLFDGGYNGSRSFPNETFFYDSSSDKILVCKKDVNMEIPICCFSESIQHLVKSGNVEVFIPLRDAKLGERKTYKTAHMLFYHLLHYPSSGGILKRVVTPNNEVYYGSCGLLLDSNKDPLLLAAVGTTENIKLSELLLYVSPKIFSDTGILHKYIKDKVIPNLVSSGTYAQLSYYMPRSVTNNICGFSKIKPKIIISDSINNFFASPFEVTNCEEASDIILNNFEDFFKFLKDV